MMDTATLERRVLKATVTATPTDGQGIFDFEVYCFEIDSDNERIKNFSNVGTGKPAANVPLDYQHTPEEADPLGTIGAARVKQVGDHLAGTAKLDIDSNPMAVAVYERLLLPEGDTARLSEVSIFYAYEVSKAFEGPKGELVQVDCELLGVAVVHKGAQRTRVTNIKEEKAAAPTSESGMRSHLAADPPGGHGMDAADVPGDMSGMTERHDAMHSDGAPHAHLGGLASASAKAIGTATIDIVPRFVGPFADMLYAQNTTGGWSYTPIMKTGRVLSSKNEAKLRQATELLTEVLASVRSTSGEDEPKAEEAKSEEPETAKAEEPPEPTELDLIRARVAGLG
jgi:hypothetical protein